MLIEAGHSNTGTAARGSTRDLVRSAERLDASRAPTDTLRAVVEEALAEASGAGAVFLVDLVSRGHKGSSVIEVYVDGEEALTIDDVATLSRRLQSAVESSGIVDGDFRLDVSTPGAGSPLRNPRQYAKHVGRTVNVEYRRDGDEHVLKGILRSATANGIEVETNGKVAFVPFNQLTECRVALPW